ncbi:MAG: tetratricopeptide repeat protein [Caldilineaceae bacterium]
MAEQRRRTARRFTFTVGGIVLFLVALYWGVNTFFPPDPDVLVVNDATNQLPDLAMEGRWEEALHVVEQSQAQLSVPDVELLIWEGVIADKLGLTERSEAALAQARQVVDADSQDLYWVTLGNTRVLAGDLDGAQAAAEAALALDPEEGQAYFLLGNIAESRGDINGAIENYERTFEYSSDANPQLAVIARVRLGTLLQSGAGFPAHRHRRGDAIT